MFARSLALTGVALIPVCTGVLSILIAVTLAILIVQITDCLLYTSVAAQLQLRSLPTSRSAYSQMEAGTYNIRVSELKALVEIFHTDYNTLFNGLKYNK